MADAPSYVLGLLDKELRRFMEDVLKKVATRYSLDFEELNREFLLPPLKLVPNKAVSIVVKKEQQPKVPPISDLRCFARVWNRGKGGQCTRKRRDGCDYCAQHDKERKHGDFRDPPNRSVFPHQRSKCVYV